MKPVHIVILILAGALGGAGLMKVLHKKPAIQTAAVAHIPAAPQPQVVEAVPGLELPPTSEHAPQAVEAAASATPDLTKPPASMERTVERPATKPVAREAPVLKSTKPSPMPVRHDPPKVGHYRPPLGNTETVERMVVTMDPEPLAPVNVAASAAPTLSPTVAPSPASTEPEHVTPASPERFVAAAPPPRQVTLNAGQLLTVRLVDGLSSERNVPGDVFHATLDRELVLGGLVVAERGARVEGRVVAVERSGRLHGVAGLAAEITNLWLSDGQMVRVQSDYFIRHAAPTRDQDIAKLGGGALLGAVIGAIAAGGKGAAIGAGIGGGAGAGDVLLTRGSSVNLASESRLNFRIKTTVTLTERLR